MIETQAIYNSVTNRKWSKLSTNDSKVNHIVRSLNVHPVIAEILSLKDIEPHDLSHYLEPKLKNFLPNPCLFLDMEKAADIVMDAIQKKVKIAVFGDYDVDGATSSALIKRFFKFIDYEVEIYIPDRIQEGYGPNINAFKLLHEKGIGLIITVDCGSTSFEQIAYAKSLGLNVIVIDHHICTEKLPIADAIVNPNRIGCQQQFGYMAAVGVSFLFALAVAKKTNVESSKLFSLLDLVALGTVCDVVPLVGLNRAFVKQGIKIIQSKSNIGLKALIDMAGVTDDIDTYHLGFILGPRINAGGRVGTDSSLGATLLSCEDYEVALGIAAELDLHNNTRKAVEISVLSDAIEKAEITNKKSPIIFVYSKDWHPGVIGIVAGRLKDKFNKPTAVIAIEEGGIGKASCRSINGIDFGDAIINAKEKGLVITGGGHAMAGGFSVRVDQLEELEAYFTYAFQQKYNEIMLKHLSYYDCDITINSVSLDLIRNLNKMGPFGTSNMQPRFLLNNATVINAQILKGEHISCILGEVGLGRSGSGLRSISFGAVHSPLGEILISKRYNLDLIVSLNINKWQDRETPQLIIHDAILR